MNTLDNLTRGNLTGYLRAAGNGIRDAENELLKERVDRPCPRFAGPAIEELDKARDALSRFAKLAGLEL